VDDASALAGRGGDGALRAAPHPDAARCATRLRVAPLAAADRPRVEAILRATDVFREDEVGVALELFDEAYGERSGESRDGSGEPAMGTAPGTSRAAGPLPTPHSRPLTADYVFVGAFMEEHTLVGYACYGPTPATDRTYDLYWIAVDPAAQGAGAGTLLLGAIERRLAEARARLLVVETSSRVEYDATRAFYAARGYREAARVGHFYAPGDDRVIYTKRLEDDGR
jgi:ribosomal protein S18 acetylase RimI-like enzyme